ncbi:glycosyltransferase [Brevibacillus laterosporus]|uniref:glycosyltransferase family 2 protein n=1 Tax=Brevibacillus laterosporus TaxID=1465 RepID=UPI0018CEE650|nr:glycosyltransferase [Brevibacillus laterosporus]MBG9799572.1 glycosyltransferase [Brevibacillus laterosporus]MCR8939303.1 glycosyltransferase [Brevibacillus laterosporus]MCZ0841943.1 glycosyltransferase [Brevibacillus laterosporus]MCZ0846001.1 glycosyltransferase [Brevibacillus laterosporus]MED1909697.1 glycosyltransferase [Brevibacillus laterosporus]
MVDQMFIFSLLMIWIMLLYHVILAMSGYRYEKKLYKLGKTLRFPEHPPFVSVLVPAHNEEKVIERTVKALCSFDYPEDFFEVIVINDCSTDRTGEILDRLAKQYPMLRPLHIHPPEGGTGKSAALNNGLRHARGEVLAVYDADNTPERTALRRLVATLVSDPDYGVAVGKFRVINAKKTLLTRFINIETINFQWMVQGGRWSLFGIASIPGTNFVIWRDVLEEAGSWDEKALAGDTELSIRIYEAGKKICFMPVAVTWEQEPETWNVWIKQRTRWVRGNSYVVMKFIRMIFTLKNKRIMFDIFYFFFTYFVFLCGVLISDVIFILSLLGVVNLTVEGPYFIIWVLAYLLFLVEIMVTLEIEKTELTWTNLFIVMLMYFTYSQLWIFLVIRGMLIQLKSVLLHEKVVWYKTDRF